MLRLRVLRQDSLAMSSPHLQCDELTTSRELVRVFPAGPCSRLLGRGLFYQLQFRMMYTINTFGFLYTHGPGNLDAVVRLFHSGEGRGTASSYHQVAGSQASKYG